MSRYGLPSRVPSDYHGIENVDVAQFMLYNRGTGSSIITGSSVHNQRIGRLWRDVLRVVVTTYRDIFYYLESSEVLDPLNDVDIFCLHIVYIPRINLSLEEFTRQHNNHGLRTEHHRSSLQLFYRPAFQDPQFDLVQPFQASGYGIDEGGPSPEVQDDYDRVVVDPVQVSFTDMQLQVLHRLIESIQEREDFGVTVYLRVRAMVTSWL